MNRAKNIFASADFLNYTEYTRLLEGKTLYAEIVKTPNKDRHTCIVNRREIVSYLNYDIFLKISRAYYDYNMNYVIKPPLTILDGNISYIYYQQLLSHITDCDVCKNCTNIHEISECNFAYNILYPYGNRYKFEPNFNFPSKIHISNKCRKEPCTKIICQIADEELEDQNLEDQNLEDFYELNDELEDQLENNKLEYDKLEYDNFADEFKNN